MWGEEGGTYANFDAGGHRLALFLRAPMAEAIGAEAPAPRPEQQDVVCLLFAAEYEDEAHRALIQNGDVSSSLTETSGAVANS